MPEQDNSVCAGATSEAQECTRIEWLWVESVWFFSTSPPLFAGRGRREAPGEGLSPRVRLCANSRKQPLTPTLSPRSAGRGSRGSLNLSLVCAGDSRDAVDDCSPWCVDGRDSVPVGPVRHGRRDDPDRCAVDADAAAISDGAACDHADGVERLARLSVAGAYPLAAGVRLSDRLRACARRLVDRPL